MQPQLAFIHGIGPHRQVDSECRGWCAELASGVRRSHQWVADALFDGQIKVRFAYYRDLFDTLEQAQGPEDLELEPEEAQELSRLFLEIIDQLLETFPEFAGDRALIDARAELVG